MSPKAVLILLVVFVLLVGVFFVAPRKRDSAPPAEGPFKPARAVFKDFRAASARSVAIGKGGRQVHLEKKGADTWILASHQNRKARLEPVTELLRGLEDASVVEMRNGNLELFGLDEAQRADLEVLGEGGAGLLKLEVGRMSEFGRSFIRLPGGEILEVDRNLDELSLVRTVNDARVLAPDLWYDLRVLAFNPEDAVEIAIKKGHQVIRVLRVTPAPSPMPLEGNKEGKAGASAEAAPKSAKPLKPFWWITEPEGMPADEQACQEIVNKAAHLSAQGYADDVQSGTLGLDPPAAKTRIVMKDGTSYTLRLGRAERAYAILQVEGRPEVWKVATFNHEAFTKPLEKFKQEAQAPMKTKVEIATPDPAPPRPTPPPISKPEIPDPPAAIREPPSPPPAVLPGTSSKSESKP